MLTARGAFLLSNSFSAREVLDSIDKDIRSQAKSGKFHTKRLIEGPYMTAVVRKQLEKSGYEVSEHLDKNVKHCLWLRISWGQAL